MLVEVHPSGAARSHHGQFHVLIAGKELVEATQDLGTLFHDGEVGSEVGVEHVVKAEVTQRGSQLAGNDGAGLHAELLAQSNAHGGCGLSDNHLVGVGEVVHELVGIVMLGEGTGGTYGDALAAVGTVGVHEHLVEGGSDGGVETTTDSAQHADRLHVVADALATAAVNALLHVAGDGGSELLLALALFATVIGHLADVEAHYQALQFTVAALGAGQAIVGVVAKHELGNGLAGADDAGTVGVNHHTRSHAGGAGGSQIATAFDLNNTNAARGGHVLYTGALQVNVAQGGNADANGLGGIKQHGPCGNSYLVFINRQSDHILFFHDAIEF